MNGFFVTGTDTEIGKTCVSAAITHVLAASGLRALAIKPIAAGQDCVKGVWVNEDVVRLHAATNVNVSLEQVGPLQMRTACAPHIAAQLEGVVIDRANVLAAIARTAALAQACVIEGVGGFRVPLTAQWDTADLAVDLGLPVVLVVGLRLGCINHALLTAEAIRARGLTLVGWVANTVDATMPHMQDNLAALRAGLGADCWGHIPRLSDPQHQAAAPFLDQQKVLDAFLINR
jgi:dethiobiotin synthetase